ncbi:MAG: hypothetical protein HXY37_02715 [Chloroflexi bacterium]|nr:hypothetical protein [Chloroflexota bacterium]
MMTWNYRVFREDDGDYVVREVFYAEDGSILGCTANPVEPFGRTLDELKASIADFEAALSLPVLSLADVPQPALSRKQARRERTLSSAEVRARLGLDPAAVAKQEAS